MPGIVAEDILSEVQNQTGLPWFTKIRRLEMPYLWHCVVHLDGVPRNTEPGEGTKI